MKNIVKICRIHGELTIEETRKDGSNFRCKACRINTNKDSYYKNRVKRIETSTNWKKNNREKYNAWTRQDRKKFPDKYKEREKLRRKKDWQKISVNESLRKLGLTNAQYKLMVENQNNKCGICFENETRMSRTGKTVARLCIDHNHNTNKIRGLLCHSCNTGIGKFKDKKELLKSAISYLDKYEFAD